MPTPDKLMEAYSAWKRASDQHNDMMRAVMGGGPLDMEAMKRKVAEIEVLHNEWMDLAGQIASAQGSQGGQGKAP